MTLGGVKARVGLGTLLAVLNGIETERDRGQNHYFVSVDVVRRKQQAHRFQRITLEGSVISLSCLDRPFEKKARSTNASWTSAQPTTTPFDP
jgi:hypothetical protein